MTAATGIWLYRVAMTTVAIATLAISGCGSSPQLNYHTLVPLPQSSTDGDAGNGILIDNVIVPPQVDRSELVVRQDASGLVVLDSDWWGAPLADEIRSALATRFARAGNSTASISASVTVTRFDSVPGHYAWLEASYQLINHKTSASARLSCTTRLRNETAGGVDALVIAHQENIQQLADQIIAAASSLQTSGEEAHCP